MVNPVKIITLLTDFGTKDPYVAVMKGVIYRIVPDVIIVDITHEIQPGNIQQGSFVLSWVYAYFPPGTIHLAVVDPGVGTSRHGLIVQTENAFFVLPDNGLISEVIRRVPPVEIICLTEKQFWLNPVSNTFHGRDIFAPVAAHLASGVPPSMMGIQFQDITLLPSFLPGANPDGSIEGKVVYIDRFGNCITNIHRDLIAAREEVTVDVCGRVIDHIVTTYGDAKKGELIALIGSGEYLEIATKDGNASLLFNISAGDKVVVRVNRR
jgi:S-adenosylmethionine hydrolase